jgi:hypothetical protein
MVGTVVAQPTRRARSAPRSATPEAPGPTLSGRAGPRHDDRGEIRQVGDERVELPEAAGVEDPIHAFGELVSGQAALGEVMLEK